MKKYIYYLVLGAVTLTACDPMSDINDEVSKDISAMKKLQAEQASQTKLDATAEEFMMSSSDIGILNTLITGEEKDKKKDEEHAKNKEYILSQLNSTDFTQEELDEMFVSFNMAAAKNAFPVSTKDKYLSEGLRVILTKNYNATSGQLVKVKYNVNNPLSLKEAKDTYTATDADYKSAGERFDNFSRESNIVKFLTAKYDVTTFDRGDYVKLTYKYYDGKSHSYTAVPMVFDGEAFIIPTKLESSEYTAMGLKYPNFSSDAQADEYVSKYYTYNNIFAKEGAVLNKIVTVRKKVEGSYKSLSYLVRMVYKSGSYQILGDNEEQGKHYVYIAEVGLAYKYKWISIPPFVAEKVEGDVTPDKKYTFTHEDYEMVGNGRYNNFDMEPTHTWAQESDEKVFIKMLEKVLRIRFATVESGTVIEVTYERYTKDTNAVTSKILISLNL
ncbi:hypothetical protein K5X82_12565 [Halosquirtibacter xylanolyticus]|uniref:hypothetical protein n=1 Tax=Halosquirtibacter xylanolyticus TaxID=3374599 RepID=UPI003747AFCA|nr:hypothetical protein K5X82_12565 [Prolixibacteraceae bacterium]